jgi:hypothetical protein
MADTYKFLRDLEELKFWWMYGMYPLRENEVYYISASARNKTLSEKEREFYQCGRSEMFNHQVVPEDNFSDFIKAVRRIESNKDAYITKSGKHYPDKCLVIYANICPTDSYFALKEQIKYLNELQTSLVDAYVKNSKEGKDAIYQNIRHCHTTGQSVFARSFSDSVWVDIDCDLNEKCDLSTIKEALKEVKKDAKKIMVIETKGGFHFLVEKSQLRELGKKLKTDPIIYITGTIVEILHQNKVSMKEVIRNKNNMIPLPGTLQYGDFVVNVINKEDFTEADRFHRYPDFKIEYSPFMELTEDELDAYLKHMEEMDKKFGDFD